MGSCLSKKSTICSSSSAIPEPPDESKSNTDLEKKKAEEGTVTVKKEIFVIKHRKSHDFDRRSEEEKAGANQKATTSTNTTTTSTTSEEIEFCNNGSISSSNVMNGGLGNGGVIVRTSSCTKEEVDAILIQCGRLSRSSSIDKTALSGSGGRKYSGSKRSYDFDCDTVKGTEIEEGYHNDNVVDGDGMAAERIHRHRQRQRQLRAASSPSHGRRRTPSRERDQRQPEQQRSGSRERGGGSGGGRRVSRSPGRRSQSPIPTSNGVSGVTPLSANASGTSTKPGKMVSVPATVSSLAMDKSNNGGGGPEPLSGTTIKRISVKRNASPRSRSPASANVSVSIDNQNAHFNQHLQQPLSLSRSNSRKAEHSPYRRTPLSEIDANIPPSHKSANNNNILLQKPMVENAASNNKVVHQGAENKISNGKGAVDKVVTVEGRAKNHQLIVEEAKGVQQVTRDTTVPAVGSGDESLKPQTLTRSRSSRRSRDLDLNPEALLNPNPSYTALLLEDIHNFHQKNTTTFSLPACVTKACSILEAVADLNSSTSSNLSCTLSDDRRSPMSQQFNKHGCKFSSGANPAGKKRLDTKDPFAESEVVVSDDLMEPSLHKYVTVRRGTMGEGDIEDQESSGSNSIVGGQQHWVSSSSWEPNSADSTDCWTTSRSNNASEDVRSRLGLGRQTFSESGCHMMNEAQRRLMSGKKRVVSDHQQIGIGRGRDGTTGRGLHTMPTTAAAST